MRKHGDNNLILNVLTENHGLYSGYIRDIKENADLLTIEIEDRTEDILHKKLPIEYVRDDIEVPDRYKNKVVPIVYGYVDKSPCVYYDLYSTTVQDGSRDYSITPDSFAIKEISRPYVFDNNTYGKITSESYLFQDLKEDTLKLASQRRGILLDDLTKQKTQISKGISTSLEDTLNAYNTAMDSTGLRSGAVEQQASEQTTRIREKGAYDLDTLMDTIGTKLMSVDEWAGGREGALRTELHKIGQGKKQAAAQATWWNPFD